LKVLSDVEISPAIPSSGSFLKFYFFWRRKSPSEEGIPGPFTADKKKKEKDKEFNVCREGSPGTGIFSSRQTERN